MTCDSAESVGLNLHKKLDNVSMRDAKIKRSEMIIGLNSKTNKVNVEKKAVPINPSVLFTRLSALAGREDNVEKYFDFELTTYPMSLFKDGVMRKPDKASLRNLLLGSESITTSPEVRVIDGGSLLHHVFWPSNVTFRDLLDHYVKSVRKDYGTCHIVYNGYSIPSVKDQEHVRRSAKLKSKDIKFTLDMKVSVKREDFLSNTNNKTLFISKLSELLENDGQTVTDTDIVKVALEVNTFILM